LESGKIKRKTAVKLVSITGDRDVDYVRVHHTY